MMATVAKVHCPCCDREWIENLFAEDHFIGHDRECPFYDCGHYGIHVVTDWKDNGRRLLREDW